MKKLITRSIAVIMMLFFIAFNVNIDKELSMKEINYSVSVTANEAQAALHEDVRLGTHTCWTTGQIIQRCNPDPEYLCLSENQDYCG